MSTVLKDPHWASLQPSFLSYLPCQQTFLGLKGLSSRICQFPCIIQFSFVLTSCPFCSLFLSFKHISAIEIFKREEILRPYGKQLNWFLCSPLGGKSLPPLTQWRGASWTTLNLQTQVLPVLGFFSPQEKAFTVSTDGWQTWAYVLPVSVGTISSGYSLIHSFTYCLAASTHSRGDLLQSVNDPQSPIYFLYDPLQKVYWPPVHIDQWPNWSSAHLVRVCSCSISVPWGWEFLFSHHHVRKIGCKTILNTNPRLWILSVASCVSLKMVFPSPRNTYSLGRLEVLSDL